MRSATSSVLIATVVAAALVLPVVAKATDIAESFTVSGSVPISSGTTLLAGSAFAQFNPADGTLTSIETALAGDASWVSSTAGETLETALFLEGVGNIGGMREFPTIGPIRISLAVTLSTATDLAAFTGTGSTIIDLLAELTPSASATGSFMTNGKLLGEVVYNYTRTTTPPAVPEPGSAALLVTGLAAFAVLGFTGLTRRRNRAAQVQLSPTAPAPFVSQYQPAERRTPFRLT